MNAQEPLQSASTGSTFELILGMKHVAMQYVIQELVWPLIAKDPTHGQGSISGKVK